jgi:hypothetical protein
MSGMRFRPQFSVRALAIVMALVCAYFGALAPTARHAESLPGSGYLLDGDEVEILGAVAVAPFLVRTNEEWMIPPGNKGNILFAHRYYFWMFGLEVRLPFESTWEGW